MQGIKDYQEMLQQAAELFIRRHQSQYLGASQALFNRAVAHLVGSFTITKAGAENVVARAYGLVRCEGDERYLDVSSSTGQVAMLVDPRSGICHAVPVAMIFQQLIDNPARRRLSAVN